MSRPPTMLHTLRTALAAELPPLVRLAGPVVAAEVGWMAMWLVDTMMVGRLGAEAIGAVSIGGHVFFAFAVFGLGMLLGLDYVVATAFGAGRVADTHRALLHGIYLSLALTVGLTLAIHAVIPWLPRTGIQPAVLAQGVPYLRATTWSLLPLLLFTALRRYLQARDLVRPIMVTVVSANLVNAFACWVLVFGHLGVPAFGVVGSGYATSVSRLYMLACLVGYIVARERSHPTGLWRVSLVPDWRRLGELARLGFPAALQTTAEVGVFAVATFVAGMLDSTALAAHQIALSAAGLAFMVPLGMSSAAAVRVGQALGRQDPAAARRAGWTAFALGVAFMACSAASFLLVPGVIFRIFTTDPQVIAIGATLLLVAAAFQLFDGAQGVLTGVLRGTGDTRTPMVANLVGHWIVGLPIGYLLCFRRGGGVVGLWVGLSVGLIAVALTLLAVWTRRARTLVPFVTAARQVA